MRIMIMFILGMISGMLVAYFGCHPYLVFSKKIKELLEKHRSQSKISCEENCICWDVDTLVCELDAG